MLPQTTKNHLKITYLTLLTPPDTNIACYRPTPENHKQHLVIKFSQCARKEIYMLMVHTSFINFYSRTFLELYNKIQRVRFLRHLQAFVFCILFTLFYR